MTMTYNSRMVHVNWITYNKTNGYTARLATCPICDTCMPVRELIPHIECDHKDDGVDIDGYINLVRSSIPLHNGGDCDGTHYWSAKHGAFVCSKTNGVYCVPAFLSSDGKQRFIADDPKPTKPSEPAPAEADAALFAEGFRHTPDPITSGEGEFHVTGMKQREALYPTGNITQLEAEEERLAQALAAVREKISAEREAYSHTLGGLVRSSAMNDSSPAVVPIITRLVDLLKDGLVDQICYEIKDADAVIRSLTKEA